MTVPICIDDPINRRILAVSEDMVQGFQRDPIGVICEHSGVDVDTVIHRIRAMLDAGTIRRVRQTLMSTKLAPGALVAWRVSTRHLDAAFNWMFQRDPFSGHVVIRSTDKDSAGAEYRLWTTLKIPQGYCMTRHCEYLRGQTGAEDYIVLPAKKLFALGVGHVRRRGLVPGIRTDEPARTIDVELVELDKRQWQVLMALKRDFHSEEIMVNLWQGRAKGAGVRLEEFYLIAEELCRLGIIGRFSTFLEHAKKLADGTMVAKYNALFHWAVPPGREMDAGMEVGRHVCMTHAYWREGGAAFNHVNIMGVVHGLDRQVVLDHKAAVDEHLREQGIPLHYSNVFWGGRSEIKPSEVSPIAYRQWCDHQGIDPEAMRT